MSSLPARTTRSQPARASRRVLLIVVSALLAILLLLMGIGALLPARWSVRASVAVNATPRAVHDVASDLATWSRWAQWDHSMLVPEVRLGSPSRGRGARLSWRGSSPAGKQLAQGEVSIVRSDPALGVWFESRVGSGPPSFAALTFSEGPGMTQVTWEDRGELTPVIGGLFRDLYQQRLERHLVRGLSELKRLVEDRLDEDRSQSDPSQTLAE